MATMTTSEFVKAREREAFTAFSMLEHKGILARLVEEVSLALRDFTRDPRGFLRAIFSDEAKDLQRSKRLRAGLALGLATQIVLFGVIAYFGWRQATANSPEKPVLTVDRWVDPKDFPPKSEKPPESAANGNGNSKALEMPKGNKDAGANAGGGGQSNPLPAMKGVLPQTLPNPAIISPTAINMPAPTLPVNPSIEGPIGPPPPPDAKIGVPSGNSDTNSAGNGTGGGIGNTGNGSSVGNNTGSGPGPGGGDRGAGKGSGTPGTPNGSLNPTGPVNYSMLAGMPDATGITWILRVKPVVTMQAQADKVHGYVLLEATFNADGTITDIVVKQHLPSMDDAAIEALQKAKFRPATRMGSPITVRRVPIKVPVNLE
jgi:TonB family protein